MLKRANVPCDTRKKRRIQRCHYSLSLHHCWFIYVNCVMSPTNMHIGNGCDVWRGAARPSNPFYNLSKSLVGKALNKMMLFRKKLHVCLLSAQSFRVCTKHTMYKHSTHTHTNHMHTSNAVTKWMSVSLPFFSTFSLSLENELSFAVTLFQASVSQW